MTVPQKVQAATRRIAEILRQRSSLLAEQVEQILDIRSLPLQVRERIIDELGNEFAEKGLRPDDEPNEYGLELESLTDLCSEKR